MTTPWPIYKDKQVNQPTHNNERLKINGDCTRFYLTLKTNDRYIASSLKIEQKMGACYHLSNCFDNLSRSSNIMEYNRLYLDCPGP